jgi:hypothetical protein
VLLLQRAASPASGKAESPRKCLHRFQLLNDQPRSKTNTLLQFQTDNLALQRVVGCPPITRHRRQPMRGAAEGSVSLFRSLHGAVPGRAVLAARHMRVPSVLFDKDLKTLDTCCSRVKGQERSGQLPV